MVSTLHRCSYGNPMISSVNKLKTIWRFSSFFLLSLFFPLLFFSISLGQRVILLNFLDTKVNPNSLLFFTERERQTDRERETRRSRVLRGWSGGAMVPGKLSVPGCPTKLDNSRVGEYCACIKCGLGLFGIFFFRLSFLFSFSLFGRRFDLD